MPALLFRGLESRALAWWRRVRSMSLTCQAPGVAQHPPRRANGAREDLAGSAQRNGDKAAAGSGPGHSSRNTAIGMTLVTRSAGKSVAVAATKRRAQATNPWVGGSVASTPKRK